MNKQVTIISSEAGDWSALYIDGKLATEGHSIRAIDVLNELGIDYEEKTVRSDWLEENGASFPGAEIKCSKGIIK